MSGLDALCFVQFLHPGGEHAPDEGHVKQWNRGNHKRKFLLVNGRCHRGEEKHEGELAFWGEWEPESEVVAELTPQGKGHPRFLYRPYYIARERYGGLQNTDPFVFDGFLYGNCQQNTVRGETQLRRLEAGSVVLFGSCLEDQFVLDTVIVVRDFVDYDAENYRSQLDGRISPEYEEVTLRALLESHDPSGCAKGDSSFRLYFGATFDKPVNGMFSFFPCVPGATGRAGFPRPRISAPGYITDNHRQGKKTNAGIEAAKLPELWNRVVDQVASQGLWLGTHASMPERIPGVE